MRASARTPRLRGDYTRMYSYIIPKIIQREDPDAFYWPSSPSSGGDFDDPQGRKQGRRPLLGGVARVPALP